MHLSFVPLTEDGRLCARSYLISTLVSSGSRKPINLPQEVNDSIVLAPAIDMEYTQRKIKLPDSPGEVKPAFTATRAQADTNGHVNNARYIDLGDEFVPTGAEVVRLRCEYKASFMPGDKIIPTVYPTDTGAVITLSNEAGELCSVMDYIWRNEK